MRKPEDTRAREVILDAAVILVEEAAIDTLSLEQLADATGLPLTDVHYHFPNMEDLVRAMVWQLFDAFVGRIETALGDDEAPGAWTRAYVRGAFPEDGTDFTRLASVLLQSTRYRPELHDAVRQKQEELHCVMLRDGIDPLRAAVIKLAVDGLWLSRMLQIPAIPEDMRASVLEYLQRTAR